jgi:NAD(P)-dependent dehydrogenase (short-subunit alcohol dehydrogenase family)
MTRADEEDPGSLERPALPAGRPGDAREIAEAIAFLARPDAHYVTGASIVANGGLMLTAAEYNRAAAR